MNKKYCVTFSAVLNAESEDALETVFENFLSKVMTPEGLTQLKETGEVVLEYREALGVNLKSTVKLEAFPADDKQMELPIKEGENSLG